MNAKSENGRVAICVSGVVGSGKTALVREIGRRIPKASILYFDAYQQACKWFPGFKGEQNPVLKWLESGADLDDYVDARIFLEDLRLLKKGMAVTMPLAPDIETENLRVEPAKVLLVECQFGRDLNGMDELIDYSIHVNTPLDVALCRCINRAESSGQVISGFAARYVKHFGHQLNRRMQLVAKTANLELDGLLDVQTMADFAMKEIGKTFLYCIRLNI